MHEPQGRPPAAQPLVIDPQELTLGALIGEGGFGKVLLNQPSICISPSLSCCQCPPGLVSSAVNACGEMYGLTCTFCRASPSWKGLSKHSAGVLWCLEGT